MAKDWKDPKTVKEVKTMSYYSKLGRWISVTIIYMPIASIITQFATTISLTIHEIKQLKLEANGSEIIKPLFLNAEYFYDVQKSPVYEIVYAMQALTACVAGTSFAAVDAFFAVIVMHLCGQLNNLKRLLHDLPLKKTDDKIPFAQLLSEIVVRHECLAK